MPVPDDGARGARTASVRVASIVEGDGEVAALPILLRRVWHEIVEGAYIDVLRPVRIKRDRVGQPGYLLKYVRVADTQLAKAHGVELPSVTLVLLDAEADCPVAFADQVRASLLGVALVAPVCCVIPTPMYEGWFVGAATSLTGLLDLPAAPAELAADEMQRPSSKSWISRHSHGSHKETRDQPKLTAAMDLALCRKTCPSFDKPCREAEGWAANPPPALP